MPVTYRYHDLLFRIILSLVAAHFIVAFGEKDSIFQLLLSWDYYRSLLLSAFIAFFLISIVYIATSRLDRQFDWKKDTLKRIGLQILLGLALPGIVAFVLATIYFRAYDIDIFVTRYLLYDFPVIIGMILLLNLYYLAYYFYLQMRIAEQSIESFRNKTAISSDDKDTKQTIITTKGTKNIPIPVNRISYIFHGDPYNFIRTRDKEDCLITESLDLIEQQLPARQFFRVNRQMLVNINACDHFENIENQKLRLYVQPEMKEPVIISQKRAKEFKEWITG